MLLLKGYNKVIITKYRIYHWKNYERAHITLKKLKRDSKGLQQIKDLTRRSERRSETPPGRALEIKMDDRFQESTRMRIETRA